MSKKNSITYDENWQSVSNSEYPRITVESDEDEALPELEQEPKPKAKAHGSLLITIQLIVCILIALAALILKSIGGELYSAAHEWYYSNLNNSAVFDGNSSFDINSLFTDATADDV